MTIDGIPDLEIGKAAEHLVVADLILSGYRAYLTEQGLPYDIVIDHDGKLYRLQVKATRCAKKLPARGAVGVGYLFQVRRAGKGGRRQYSNGEFDILALVALDVRVIAYLPFNGSIQQTIHLRPHGHMASARAERTRTIDQFPIQSALAVISGTRPTMSSAQQLLRATPIHQGELFETA